MEQPLKKGKYEGRRFTKKDFESALSRYYQLRGWDINAVPTAEKLCELGLDHL